LLVIVSSKSRIQEVVALLLFSLSLFGRALTSSAELNSEKIEVAEHSSTALLLTLTTGYSCVSL